MCTWQCLELDPLFRYIKPAFSLFTSKDNAERRQNICDPPHEKVPLGAKNNIWVYCTLLQTRQYWPDWWRFHSFASFRCLVTVLQSQGTLKLIIGEKHPWMIEWIFRLAPCHVNKMTCESSVCFLLFCLAVHIPKNLRQETGETIIVWELCSKLGCSSEKVTPRSPL